MAYSDGEAAILTRLQAVTGFDSDNTSRGNWKIMNQGHSRQYAIIRQGPGVYPHAAPTTIIEEHQTIVEVFYRLRDDSTTATGLQGVVEDIKASLRTYRKWGDATNVLKARVSGHSEMREVVKGDVHWFYQEIYLDWQAQISITYAE